MKTQSIVGIDIGGTKINIGKVVDGKVLNEQRYPTNALRSEKEIINDIISGIEQVIEPETIGIGIGVPGLVDEENGIVLDVTNIPAFKETHLKEIIESHFKLPVRIANDANCFAIGVKTYGSGNKYKNIVCLTLGTGVGAGIITNNQLYSGKLSIAGEFGSLGYLDKNYEYYCSGKFFQGNYHTTPKELFEKALNRDVNAIKIFDEFGGHLGELIKTILLTYGPEAIFLGGSISNTFRFFQKGMLDSVNQFPFKRIVQNLEIMVCERNKIPVLGAAALIESCKNEISQKVQILY
jgi:glucokinase